MTIDTVTIDSILLEHTAIHRAIQALRDAVAAQATFLLQSANKWDKTNLGQLRNNHLQLKDSMQAFHESLQGHCAREEEAVHAALGELLVLGNISEHREIMRRLDRAQALLGKTKLLGDLQPQELMATTYEVAQTVEMVCHLVDVHETNEAGLFDLLKKGLNTRGMEPRGQ